MDTSSHLLFGLTLAGLSLLDPSIGDNPSLAQAVMIGTVIGSNAPDFDTVVRLKGYSSYMKHHRGITHSIPALFVWPLLISFLVGLACNQSEHILILYLWSFIAVFFHVFLDALNSYGVQCLRPWNTKWIHLDILPIFDPFLFSLHAIGLISWFVIKLDPAQLFSFIYIITFIYIAVRVWHHYCLVKRVFCLIGKQGTCHVIPTLSWFHWTFVLETDECFYTGMIGYRNIEIEETYVKQSETPIIQATKDTDGVQAFLGFAQQIYVTCRRQQDGYEVIWRDVRFWYNHKLLFGVDVRLDNDLKILDQRTGWRKKYWEPPYV